MSGITWNEIIELSIRQRLGDVQLGTPDGTMQGPIESIEPDRIGTIIIRAIWLSRRLTELAGWQKARDRVIRVSPHCTLTTERFGGIRVDSFGGGRLRIIERTDPACLDPQYVHGLAPDEIRRTRAWMNYLPLDAKWPAIIAKTWERHSAGMIDNATLNQVQSEVAQFYSGK